MEAEGIDIGTSRRIDNMGGSERSETFDTLKV